MSEELRVVHLSMSKKEKAFALYATQQALHAPIPEGSSSLKVIAEFIKDSFNASLGPHWNVAVGLNMYTAARRTQYIVLSWKPSADHRKKLGKKLSTSSDLLTILIFKVVSNLNVVKSIKEKEGEKEEEVDLSKVKVIEQSPNMTEAMVKAAQMGIMEAFNTKRDEKGSVKMEAFSRDVRKALNDRVIGNLWHVVAARMGELEVAKPENENDYFLEVYVANKLRVVCWRHDFHEESAAMTMVKSPNVWCFFLAFLFFFLWFSSPECTPARCSLREDPCSEAEALEEISSCESKRQNYVIGMCLFFFVYLLSRKIQDVKDQTKANVWNKEAVKAAKKKRQ